MLSTYHSIYLINFITGIESGFIKIAFTLWLKDLGVPLVQLAVFNIIYLTFSFKVLWLPLIEHMKNPLSKLGHRKSWLLFMDILMCLSIFILIFLNPLKNLYTIFIVGMLLAAIAATKESLAIAFQMENIAQEKWGELEGNFTIYYNTGLWVGGILVFFASSYIAWKSIFLLIIFLISCMCTILLFFMPNTIEKIKQKSTVKEKFLDPYKDLVKKNQKHLLSLISFIVLYRLQDRVLMSLSNYFLLDCNASKLDFSLGKTIGVFMAILGGLGASYFVKRFKYKKTLLFGMLLHAILFVLFMAQAYFPSNIFLYYCVMISEKLIRGFEGNVFFTYQLLFCNVQYAMVQSSMLFALDKFFGTFLSIFAGYVVIKFGWVFLFICSFLLTLSSLIFLKKLPNSIEDIKK